MPKERTRQEVFEILKNEAEQHKTKKAKKIELLNNKEKPRETCGCGGKYFVSNKKSHEKSQRHLAYVCQITNGNLNV